MALASAPTVKNTTDDLKLEGLTGNGFTLAVARETGGSGWIDLNGLQLEATPEPSTGLWGAVSRCCRRVAGGARMGLIVRQTGGSGFRSVRAISWGWGPSAVTLQEGAFQKGTGLYLSSHG